MWALGAPGPAGAAAVEGIQLSPHDDGANGPGRVKGAELVAVLILAIVDSLNINQMAYYN
jgi:hypothetical protein